MKVLPGIATIVASTLFPVLQGHAQPAPIAAAELQNISGCSLDGNSVFIATGQGTEARRYKYPWDASIDALCNAKGFAIPSPSKTAPTQDTKQVSGSAAGNAPAAAPAPGGFPADALALDPSALKERLSGKVYELKPAGSPDWRWQFRADGYFFFNSGAFSDSGKWSIKESAVCSEGRKIPASCNEVRQVGSDLFLKRDSGEVVRMSVL
jgi:hypothetical protein